MEINSKSRRDLLSLFGKSSLATAIAGGIPEVFAQEKKLTIGYWPIAAGLPFYAAMEKGFFKQAGINVEAVKFASPNQVVDAMVAGRIDGCANGTAITVLALADAQMPGSIKFTCMNFANEKYILDQFIVPINSTVTSISELAGKKVACGPGINNVTLTKAILQGNGITNAQVIELPITQILPALASGQIDGAYVLEPSAVIGKQQKISKSIGAGVVSKYVLGDNLPWFGGAAALLTKTFKEKADMVPKYLKAYAAGVEYVRKNGLEANQYLKGYTAIEGDLAKEVPISGYVTYDEVRGNDVKALQRLFDVFADRKVFEKQIPALNLLYKPV
jgi:NitT/TauT family transport system substrate-binding protein